MLPALKLEDVLGSFSDPATPVETQETPASMVVQLTREGQRRTYVLDKPSSRVTARDESLREFVSSESLVASSDFADLRAMAATQRRVLEAVHRERFIEPNLQIDDNSGITAIHAALDAPVSSTARVILLDGPAGVGKTHILKRLAFERASGYLQGRGRPLLYVASRRSRLSGLPDALAIATQSLRTRFTYEHVPLLVRMGLLDLAIDGFDELVDADGYRDAWHAMRDFLAQLDGRGTCILAGRDTFFDQQGLRDRLEEREHTIELVTAHVMPVSVTTARAWLSDSGWSNEAVDEVSEWLQSNEYLRRPYFLSRLAGQSDWEDADAESARRFLVHGFIERESRIIAQSVDIDPDRAREGMSMLLQHIALDMAERESNEVDVEYVGLLYELVFESWLHQDDLRKLQHKAGSTALLEPSSSPRLRRFPHSELQHHFLAQGLLDELAREELPLVLRRGVLGTDFLAMFVEAAERYDGDALRRGLRFLDRRIEREIGADRLTSNAGAILIASLAIRDDGVRDGGVGDHTLPSNVSNIQTSECALIGTVRRSAITNCTIFRLDARGADLSAIAFERSHVGILIGDSLTKLGPCAPNIDVIHDAEDTTSPIGRVLRSPAEIRAWMIEHGWTEPSGDRTQTPRRHPFEEYCERVIRRSIHQFYFRKHTDDLSSSLLQHPWWPEVESILDEEGRVKRTTKPAGGTRSEFVHIRSPRGLLMEDPTDEGAARIWRRIRARAQQLG